VWIILLRNTKAPLGAREHNDLSADMPQTTLRSYFSKPAAISLPSISPTSQQVRTDDVTISDVFSRDNSIKDSEGVAKQPQTAKDALIRNHGEVDVPRIELAAQNPDPTPLEPLQITAATEIASGISKPLPTQLATDLPKAVLSPVTAEALDQIRHLISATLPVRYSDKFVKETLTNPSVSQLSRVVSYDGEIVGCIRCRLELCSPNTTMADNQEHSLSQIYIQALALLAPYRGLGLASLLLEKILASEIARNKKTVSVYAHVWEKNEDALEWYRKRGFKRVLMVDGYYKRLKPSGAWIVRKELHES
jgi:N-alpha-acetyltransferase 50